MKKLYLCFVSLFFFANLSAQHLEDRNGDTLVTLLAFGDSLTSGVGDSTEPGEEIEVAPSPAFGGYPAILQNFLGVTVANSGKPGEIFTTEGLVRFVALLSTQVSDNVLLFEGVNDALFRTSSVDYGLALQKSLNAARVTGKKTLLFTLPPTCCNRTEQRAFIRDLNSSIRNSFVVNNDVLLVDVERAFDFLCPAQNSCSLFNEPEGLHPNRYGYRVIAELVAAVLLDINLFEPGGSSLLEQALGLESGTVTPLTNETGEEE